MKTSKGLHEGLLQTAEHLLNSGSGRPNEAHLRRAVSSVYYALFHNLAQLCADSFIGTYGVRNRSNPAWQQVYRALNHGIAKSQCNQAQSKNFPDVIKRYAALFSEYQRKRHDADYDPYANTAKEFKKEDILKMISEAEQGIKDLKTASACDLKAFSAFVLLKKRQPPSH